MGAVNTRPERSGEQCRPAWQMVVQGAFALAAAMGIGRFVFTPILPLMQAQAGMSAQTGNALATANYVGYLAGAVAAIVLPRLARSIPALRTCLVLLAATLAGMAVTTDTVAWLAMRAVAGVASALIFVIASNATLQRLRSHAQHLTGWVYCGVGAGIAVSGLCVLAVDAVGGWQLAWWVAATLTTALAAVAWRLPAPQAPAVSPDTRAGGASGRRRFAALLVGYSLEGAGYIIAGTFLVAALSRTGPAWLGNGAWVLVGLAAAPSCVLWAAAAHRFSRPSLLIAALLLQAVGMALPALFGGIAAALVSAVLFGGTFMGVTTLTLATGAHLGVPRATALLTAGYSLGQVLGPLGVAPLLTRGYGPALLVAAVLAAAAAAATALLRLRSPAAGPVDGSGPGTHPGSASPPEGAAPRGPTAT
ncbi:MULTISPECIES: YbfB/YjiJ family MFS transporter [Prauserella salsuginis group]|uniref:YbfB/YjiJ family MFS transporter n=1 Tax=Prauserella salsuginis TaxID=387889 RepID=A0ABW6G7L1_9PSEU|nr:MULTISPECIES: YbfB/YjiJ family MFS transporter [Prauserella salsuginis group]MCR3719546.1 putative arabinose efflux permease, MFS family [Prauserella flava]MCR3735440.1 putative arabinose efflux permease, MFS family [Prauserella salsuginis]